MDTRDKILTLDAVRRLGRPLTVVATASTVLRADFVRELEALRVPGRPLLAVVLPAEPELLPRRARADLLAGLRVVDYVAIAEPGELDGLDAIHLEAADVFRTGQLIRQVRGFSNFKKGAGREANPTTPPSDDIS
jgi:hypothetical protein